MGHFFADFGNIAFFNECSNKNLSAIYILFANLYLLTGQKMSVNVSKNRIMPKIAKNYLTNSQ